MGLTKVLQRALLGAVCIGGAALAAPATLEPEALSAGEFTIDRADADAYREPAPVLSYRQREVFLRGRQHFNQKWVQAPSLAGDWGLGPTFVADRCSACHVNGGRGYLPASAEEQISALLVRVSLPGEDEHGRPRPHPNYGDQLQNQGLMGQGRDATFLGERVFPEAELYLDWEESSATLADGTLVPLHRPRLRIAKLYFGPLGPEILTSLRLTQPLVGPGLLEAVPEATLLAIAQQQRALGFNGRANYVWDDIGQRRALGRFGWKANQPTLKQQIAAAFLGDVGVTTSLYRVQECPGVQEACRAQPPGNDPELIDLNWEELEFWTQALAVPARRNWKDPVVRRGGELFAQARCDVCHVPEMRTGPSQPRFAQMADQTFHAYTDLLLHDMGEALADGRPDFLASGRDWRTQPLWGLGLSAVVAGSSVLLHDGRARDVTEAILWHGGEAEVSREYFRRLPKADREALSRFVESL